MNYVKTIPEKNGKVKLNFNKDFSNPRFHEDVFTLMNIDLCSMVFDTSKLNHPNTGYSKNVGCIKRDTEITDKHIVSNIFSVKQEYLTKIKKRNDMVESISYFSIF